MTAIPEDLNFDKKMASIGYKDKKRVVQQPTNGSVFTFGNNGPEIPIYGNKPNSHTNNRKMLLLADIVNTNVGCTYKFEGRVGTGGVIKNFYIRSAGGEEISNIQKYNVLYGQMLQKNVDSAWYINNGKQLYAHAGTPITNATGTIAISGTATDLTSNPVVIGDTLTKFLPLTLSSFFDIKYWSLAGETVYISMDLESSIIAAIGAVTVAGSTCDSSDLQLQNVRLIYDVYEMEPKAWDLIKKQTGGQLNYYGKEYLHRTDYIASGDTELTTTLGWKKKYLTKLIAGIRNSTDISTYSQPSLTNRTQGQVSEYSLSHDGTVIGQKVIEYKGGCVAYAEMLKSNGELWDMHSDSLNYGNGYSMVSPTGLSDATMGSFLMELDFESLYQDEHSLSGLDVYNSLQFNIKKGSVAEIDTVDIFGEYSSRITIDFNDGGLITAKDNWVADDKSKTFIDR